mgnify:CR=1 FL=1
MAYAGWRCLPMGRFGGGLGAGRREAPKWADVAGLRCPVREAGGWLKRLPFRQAGSKLEPKGDGGPCGIKLCHSTGRATAGAPEGWQREPDLRRA